MFATGQFNRPGHHRCDRPVRSMRSMAACVAGLIGLPLLTGPWPGTPGTDGAMGPGAADASIAAAPVSVDIIVPEPPAVTPAALAGGLRAAHADGCFGRLLGFAADIRNPGDRRRLSADLARVAAMESICVNVRPARTASARTVVVTGPAGDAVQFRAVPGADGAWRVAPRPADD